jgi:uncharacterized C2H2 Zn-finger protein
MPVFLRVPHCGAVFQLKLQERSNQIKYTEKEELAERGRERRTSNTTLSKELNLTFRHLGFYVVVSDAFRRKDTADVLTKPGTGFANPVRQH